MKILQFFKPTLKKIIVTALLTAVTYFIIRYSGFVNLESIGSGVATAISYITQGYLAFSQEQETQVGIFLKSFVLFAFWYLIVCTLTILASLVFSKREQRIN